MLQKVDYKKDFKEYYLPKAEPGIIVVPPFKFAVIDGQGNPNEEGFAEDTAALYSFSYAVKMSSKAGTAPAGYHEFTVFPLEGIWDLVDHSKGLSDKGNLKYRIMIRQPEFMTEGLFERFLSETRQKKQNPSLSKINWEVIEDGMCCQMMHLGPYDEEPASFLRMEQFCDENGYKRSVMTHREIYLSDPRRTEPAKMRTVLRFKIEAKVDSSRCPAPR